MRKLLPLSLLLLFVGCQVGSGTPQTSTETDGTSEVTLDWEVKEEAPGEYDEPRNSLTLVVSGASKQRVALGTFSGSFADGRELSVEDTTGAILKGIFWFAGAGDEFIVERPDGDTLVISHRQVDEQVEPGDFKALKTIQIPATATVRLAPWMDL